MLNLSKTNSTERSKRLQTKKVELSDKIDNYENLIVFENGWISKKIEFSKYNQIHFVLLKNDERMMIKLDDKAINSKSQE